MTEHIADNLCELIGGTPLVRLSRLGKDLPGEIVGKLEVRNPAASVKDRIGLAMIKEAEGRAMGNKRKTLKPVDL